MACVEKSTAMFDIYSLIQPIFVGRGQASSVVLGSGYHRKSDSASSWADRLNLEPIGGTKMRHCVDSA